MNSRPVKQNTLRENGGSYPDERANPASQTMDTELQEDQKGKGYSRGKNTLGNPVPKRTVRDAPPRKGPTKEGDPVRYVVRVVSVRIRLLDEDNLCPKYVCDFLRYCGALPGDAPGICKIETTQRKVEKEEPEHTEVRVWALYE